MLCEIVLYCDVFCSIDYHIMMYCVMFYFTLYLHHIILYYVNVLLYNIMLYYIVLHYAIVFCIILLDCILDPTTFYDFISYWIRHYMILVSIHFYCIKLYCI